MKIFFFLACMASIQLQAEQLPMQEMVQNGRYQISSYGFCIHLLDTQTGEIWEYEKSILRGLEKLPSCPLEVAQ
jgi:hypothetical protein